jgi:Ala-tRNA(Pro) deacylase
MIPSHIVEYLKTKGVPFVRHWHPRAVGAQKVAQSMHVTGHRVAKAVIVDADGHRWIAVLPASQQLDDHRLAAELAAHRVRLVREDEFAASFRDCERGAEPPFGHLYDLPVVVDRSLSREDRIYFRAGSHEETLEMSYSDFAALEQPKLATFGWH